MKRQLIACFLVFSVLFLQPLTTWGADAAAIAERQEAEERYNRLSALVEDMRDAYQAQQKRIERLNTELTSLREENFKALANVRKEGSAYATREDLKKLAEKLVEIDGKRESDKKLILEEIQKLAKLPPPVVITKPTPAPEAPRTVEKKDETPLDPNAEYYPYVIQKGDTLLAVVGAYNTELKKQGKPTVTLEQVRKANPKANINSLRVGQEILIPVPVAK